MRILLLTAAVIIMIPRGTTAQETETLFSENVSHGVYVSPVYGATSLNGEFTYLRGTRGAWLMNMNNGRTVNLGLARYWTHTEFEPVNWTNTDENEPDMSTRYGGFELEYVHQTNSLFHFSAQALIGSGTVEYADSDLVFNRPSDSYFVLQPGINLNLNVTEWFRLSGSVFYRYTEGVDLEGTSDKDLSGTTSYIALRFGLY